MAPTCPSIIADGATMSAPASAWLTAVRARSSRDSSFRTSPSRTTPQWPCEVYSHRQVSAMTTISGAARRTARMASCTTPRLA